MEINIKRLQRFVKTLQSMKQDIRINMNSPAKPRCGTPGCHAGLAMLALDKMRVKQTKCFINHGYHYRDQANRLARYLFRSKDVDFIALKAWAEFHVEIWGNGEGYSMFEYGMAFDQDTDFFPSSVIVDHWAGVLDRLTEHRKAFVSELGLGLPD